MARLLALAFLILAGCTPLVAEVFHVAGGGLVPVAAGPAAVTTSTIVGVPETLTLIPKGAQLLTPQLKTAGGETLDGVPFTFSSSNPLVVDVINGELRAVGPGTATITITGGGATETIEVVVSDVTLSETEPDIAAVVSDVTITAIDDTFDLSVLTANTTGTVEWVSLDPSVGTIQDLGDGKAQVTALKEGTVQIQAILKENGVEIKRVTITVTVKQEISVIQVEPDPAVINNPGESLQLTARAYDANNHLITRALDFDWASSNASRVSVDANGKVTAQIGSNKTTTQITITAEGFSSSSDVTVGAGATVQIDQGPATLTSFGAQSTFTATVANSTGTVLWSLSNANVAGAPASGPTTTVTAQANGTVTLTATLMEGVEAVATDTVTITVQQTVSTIDLAPLNTTLALPGDTVQLTATARDAGGNAIAGVTFNWTSNNVLLTVDANGLVTAQPASFNESATLRASVGAIQSNAVTVAVGAAPTLAVNCAGAFPIGALGDTRTCTATVTGAAGAVVWTLENQAIANHDAALGAHTTVASKVDNGNDTTITAVHDGQVTVKASFLGLTDQVTIDVEQAVASVSVTPTLVTLTRQYDGLQTEAQNESVGAMGRYVASAADSNANPIERTLIYSWDTSDPLKASAEADVLSKNGKAKALAAVALNETLTVTATAETVVSTQTNNLVLNYAAGNVPVIVIIP